MLILALIIYLLSSVTAENLANENILRKVNKHLKCTCYHSECAVYEMLLVICVKYRLFIYSFHSMFQSMTVYKSCLSIFEFLYCFTLLF